MSRKPLNVVQRAHFTFEFPALEPTSPLHDLEKLRGITNLERVVVITKFTEVGSWGSSWRHVPHHLADGCFWRCSISYVNRSDHLSEVGTESLAQMFKDHRKTFRTISCRRLSSTLLLTSSSSPVKISAGACITALDLSPLIRCYLGKRRS
ncbi:hypothetical protein EV702DRAFT_1199227 [Suillus placidus]|uniref:Uncharacterized protein n=1 Tax=Suillus placidus TaxID=48579 RepID=A0A9P6ZSJ9_9AGAM|nr:hypothetical protein EV702DRAFT_1199227 [Suillus placidus]